MNIYFLLLKHPSGQSLFRAIATVFAVILATLIILVTIAFGQGWMMRDQKANLAANLFPPTMSTPVDSTKNPVYLSTYDAEFNSLPIKQIGIRKTNQADTLPGGLKTTPNDNEIWVTPGLKKLIDTHPTFAERYAEYSVKAVFPSEIAPSPDSLMLLYQIREETVRARGSQLQVSSAAELWSRYDRQIVHSKGDTVLKLTLPLLAGVAIITPVLLLIAEIARIGIVQREKRYAALSLAGMTTMQLRLLIAAETVPLSLLGVALGIATFILVGMPVLAHVSVGGSAIWFTDLKLSSAVYLVVCTAIVICSVLAGLQSINAVKISPLAVSRTPSDIKRPSLLSMLPLLFGITGLSVLSAFGRPWFEDNQELGTYTIFGLVLTIILGIFFAGPYLTRLLSAILLRSARRASTMMAAHRLRSVSRKEFHSISGIVLALFVGTLFMTLLATIQATGTKYQVTQASVVKDLNPLQNPLQVTVTLPDTGKDAVIKSIKQDVGLGSLLSSSYIQKGFRENSDIEDGSVSAGSYYDSCSVYRQRTGLACDKNIPADSPFIASLQFNQIPGSTFSKLEPRLKRVNPASGVISDDGYVLVAKDGQSLERVANKVYDIASDYYLKSGIQLSIDYAKVNDVGSIAAVKGVEALITMILIIIMTTGGLSLLVNVIGSIFERKRTFIRLRVVGASIGALARSLSVEVLAPLCALSIFVAGLGIFSCYCILATIGAFSDGQFIFSLPSANLWIGLGVTIILCIIVSLLNIPLLAKLIDFDELRSE